MINIMKPANVPFRSAAADVFRRRLAESSKVSPMSPCKPTGASWINSMPLPHKIVQTPGLILVLHEGDTVFRPIFLDSRAAEDAVPRLMGYSTGAGRAARSSSRRPSH